MRKHHKPLQPGQKIGELTLIDTYITNHVRYWRAKCSCGSYRVIRDGNLKSGGVTKCRSHISNRLAQLTRMSLTSISHARVILRDRYGMEEAWLKDIIAFAEVYTSKYAGEDLVPRIPGNPIGPSNYAFVAKTKVSMDCKTARDQAAKWMGKRAYEVSKQYIYHFLRKKANEQR